MSLRRGDVRAGRAPALSGTVAEAMDTTDAMEPRSRRIGRPITPEQFAEMSDAALMRLVPRAYRDCFPGKEDCANCCFYLYDGTAWSFFKGALLDDQ